MVNAKQRKRKRERASALVDTAPTVPVVAPPKKEHRPVVPSLTAPAAAAAVAKKKFLTANDGPAYHQLLHEQYRGFVVLPAARVQPPSFHRSAKRALETLRDAGYYQYDMVMAGGKNLSRTFVQRTLVGDPGITYKYLGLRLFAHAWSGPPHTTCSTTPDVFRSIYDMNQEMIRMTKEQLKQLQPPAPQQNNRKVGSCEYNLTLINYMEPACETVLREEETYGMGKQSVSWHADSSLQDYSSIGVYHTLPTQKASTWDWKIALRRNPPNDDNNNDTTTTKDAAAEIQAVVVPTKSGDVYFLLDEFNHTHQHLVLAGSTARRISSTHRVAVTETDTYEYIRHRCSTALTSVKAQLKNKAASDSSAAAAKDWNVDVLLEAQAVLTEVEFEWIAQYWVQGAQHDVQHVWWQAPMRALEQAWGALEKQTFKIYTKCCYSCSTTSASSETETVATVVPRELLVGLLAAFKVRMEWRTKWDDRRADKIYKRRISRPYQPVEHPIFLATTTGDSASSCNKRLPKDLTDAISNLTRVLAEHDKKSMHGQKKSKPTTKPAGKASGVQPPGKRSHFAPQEQQHSEKRMVKKKKLRR